MLKTTLNLGKIIAKTARKIASGKYAIDGAGKVAKKTVEKTVELLGSGEVVEKLTEVASSAVLTDVEGVEDEPVLGSETEEASSRVVPETEVASSRAETEVAGGGSESKAEMEAVPELTLEPELPEPELSEPTEEPVPTLLPEPAEEIAPEVPAEPPVVLEPSVPKPMTLTRILPDGDNDEGKGWQCSKYAYYLATGVRMNYAPHPDYGPCHGAGMVDYLITNLGWRECEKKNGAIFSYNDTSFGHTGVVVDAERNLVNDANTLARPLAVETHVLDLEGLGARYAEG